MFPTWKYTDNLPDIWCFLPGNILITYPESDVFNLCEETISRTDEGQPRPKYIFNKCGTNIYFFILYRGLVHHHHRILNLMFPTWKYPDNLPGIWYFLSGNILITYQESDISYLEICDAISFQILRHCQILCHCILPKYRRYRVSHETWKCMAKRLDCRFHLCKNFRDLFVNLCLDV